VTRTATSSRSSRARSTASPTWARAGSIARSVAGRGDEGALPAEPTAVTAATAATLDASAARHGTGRPDLVEPLTTCSHRQQRPLALASAEMFTGIVRERARVVARESREDGARLVVDAPATARDARLGDSVAVDGVCLTVTAVDEGRLAFDAVPETVRRSALGALEPHDEVNVEPALRAGEPLGGHVVQGHVDAVGTVRSSAPEGDGLRVWIEAPADLLRLCVEKGSIAVQGVSLTVAELDDEGFAVALVPHTLAVTTLGRLAPGDAVNLEADVLAKYVERLLGARTG
jgi:riboflavin synthase